jgi:hypothetical protein
LPVWHAQHIELADQISEDDCAVAGWETNAVIV